MRLLTLTVRNYRVHKETTVHFDPSRNLIGGPNEIGKSTLAEAAHRALFLRAKTGGAIQAEMRSTLHLGHPEVTLSFEACGSRWNLEKRFAGTQGSARLTSASGTTFRDDEAESKLCEILKWETNGGRLTAKELPAVWAHLWVWQGSSGADPSGHASQHQDTLVQRLQQDGLAAVMQSSRDQQVRERIAASYEELFTPTGRFKAGSKPELARAQLTEATTALERARETAARLEQAASDHSRAEKTIAETEAISPGLEAQRVATEQALAKVHELRQQEETQLKAWENAVSHQKQLVEIDATIRTLSDQATAARDALGPAERIESDLLTEKQRTRETSDAAEAAQRQNADALRKNHLNYHLVAAAVTAFEKAAEHQRLTTRAAEANEIRAKISHQNESLSRLPAVTSRELEILRKLDLALSQASASLKAMASSVELITSDQPVTLDGKSLTPGEAHILSDAGELLVGDGTRIRIRPGGGATLSEVRISHDQAGRALATALQRHALRDLDQAIKIFQQRETLSQQIAQLETRWKALGGETLASEVDTASAAHEAAKAEVHRRLEALEPGTTAPSSLDAARELLTNLRQALDHAEAAETSARRHAEDSRKKMDASVLKLQSHQHQTNEARQKLREMEIKLQLLKETHGDAESRQASIVSARETEKQWAAQLAATRKDLAALTPDLLAADLDRFKRAIAQQETRRREAEDQRLVARNTLTLDGSSDPEAELSHALARHTAAAETHASEERRALAISKLHQLFSESRDAIHRSVVEPLAERITGYLQCVFGPATQVRVSLSDAGIKGFEITRGDGACFSFQSLSGGAKEQVAAAVRLAMAEILANDHDGSLPILFDDAFAYTDPERVQSLQRMLNLAALRGLQIIVLTCTPNDYSAFGAVEARIDQRAPAA